MDLHRLIEIADKLNLQDKVNELKFYEKRLTSPDKDLILPLVGEFSSGKTTLINSLLDNPNLETASRATTASIFEIRFGSNKCRAVIVGEDGLTCDIDDVANIKNSGLQQVEVVKVYDTSKRIGASTILVDTPGLSSNNPAHKIALSSYLPNADAILLLTDVNQQITRSLIDFLNTSKLANKPIYAVITKCDTKTPEEVAMAKSYIQKTIEIPFAKIIAVSSTTGNMSEFDNIISEIQAHKNSIVENSVKERVRNIAKELILIVNNLLKQGNSTDELDNAIEEEENKLKKLNRNIDSLLAEAENRIDDKANHAVSQFSKSVFSQVDRIVKAQGRDCSDSVNCAVNSIAVMIMQNYQKDIFSDILSLARSRQSKISEVPMGVLETIDMAGNSFNGFSTTVDLSNAGHELDKKIGIGVIAALAVGATIFTAGAAAAAGTAAAGTAAAGTAAAGTAAAGTAAAGTAAAGTAAAGTAAAGTAAAGITGGTIIAADAITDVASTAYTAHKMKKYAQLSQAALKAKQFTDNVNINLDKTQQYDQEIGKRTGMRRGFIETSVGWVTEFFAKPTRQRAVNEYIDGTLVPEFRQQVLSTSSTILNEVSSLLRKEAGICSESILSNLQYMKKSLSEKKEEHAAKIQSLKQYITELNEI